MAIQGLAQSTQREALAPLQRCTRHVWPAQVTLVMVISALEMALMMLVADVPTLHCTVEPTLLKIKKEEESGNHSEYDNKKGSKIHVVEEVLITYLLSL